MRLITRKKLPIRISTYEGISPRYKYPEIKHPRYWSHQDPSHLSGYLKE